MKADTAFTAFIEIGSGSRHNRLERTKRGWQSSLLMFMTASLLTSMFGLVLAAASLLGFVQSNGVLSIAGTVLLAVSFPLLVMTAHCLDRIGEIDRAIRIRSFRRNFFEELNK